LIKDYGDDPDLMKSRLIDNMKIEKDRIKRDRIKRDSIKRDSISIKDLSLKAGKKLILDSVFLDIDCKLALVGPNGSGKTSIIAAISGFMKYQAGSISIVDYKDELIDSNDIGIVIQASDFDRDAKVIDEIEFYEDLGLSKHHIKSQLVKYGIDPQERIRNLPHGKWKILLTLQAMINSPGIILLDEPFSGLDILNRRIIEKMLKEYDGNILITSHILDEVSRICSKIAFVNHGKIIEVKELEKINDLEEYYIKLFSE
jgi:ABC-2 type transport system ATP-binding protein